MKNALTRFTITLSLLTSLSAQALTLTSQDIHEGHPLDDTFINNGWGCAGHNLSPQLAWQQIPKGTKSFAITAFDPDAPTGSGFWHWVVIDLPANVHHLPRGADIRTLGGKEIRNDFGQTQYGGACPPKGNGMHRYQFTVWALPTKTSGIAPHATAAVASFTLHHTAIGHARLTAIDTRP